MERLHFESIDSTNNYIKRNYESLNHLSWVTSEVQTNGKGRSSKSWYGDEDSLLCSILIKEQLPVEKNQMIPLLAAKSLHHVLSKYHQSIEIKWPNDLLIHSKKVAGILVESVVIENEFKAVIIGFGVNVNQLDFPDSIKDIATSLSIDDIYALDINQILTELNKRFIKDYEIFKKNHIEVIHYCNDYLAYKNKTISYVEENKTLQGNIEYINNNGHLVVSRNKEFIPLISGEIALLK
ncbi:MAG: biotin--[acetyl-CoA-carboxylase] ligase [Tenericutes bacterium HGW-Tenericutes-2]|jgi:BirA family biotin operon repressor/biotin-[acetyl-CoA-carboxylase] ligase|nr:MAG: biotin--[acetyl-CoA-carboxylase] ligase [Tenericutes bacterium HGW-Tenericutes-2]